MPPEEKTVQETINQFTTPEVLQSPLVPTTVEPPQQVGDESAVFSSDAARTATEKNQVFLQQEAEKTALQEAETAKAAEAKVEEVPVGGLTFEEATAVAEDGVPIQDQFEEQGGVFFAKADVTPTPEAQAALDLNTQIDKDTKEIDDLLDTLSERSDSVTRSLIRGLKGSFAQRAEEFKAISAKRQAGLRVLGIRKGRERFAPEIQSGIIAGEQRELMKELTKLDAQQQLAVAQAEEANLNRQFSITNSKVAEAKELRNQKLQKLEELQKLELEQSEALAEERKKVDIESNIANLIQSGITDPLGIFSALNFDEKGNRIGKASFEEVTDFMKQLSDAKQEEELPASLEEYTQAINLGIIGPDTSFFEWTALKAAAGRTPGTQDEVVPGGIVDAAGNPIDLSAGQTNTLAGFNTTISAAADMLGLVESGVKTGPVVSAIHEFNKARGNADEDLLRLEQGLAKLKADFMKALSGAAVSEPEVKRLAAFLPSITDQESVLKSKLKTLRDETGRSKEEFLKVLGAATPGEDGDRVEVISPDGVVGDVPREQLQEALDSGFKLNE